MGSDMAVHPQHDKPKRRRTLRFTIDLGNPAHRRNLILAVLVLFLVTTGFIFAGYKVYEYTESSEFCGTVCHPMVGQFTRYEISDHVNVECAKCHIGPGADFFVKSKIDGLRQVYAVLTHTYSVPILSPVENLRPARETCETCHTPTSFRDNLVKTVLHYENDVKNTPIQSTFILKLGGWKESTGVAHGIHWHITNKVYYIAADRQRQVMSWVGVELPDGTLKEYIILVTCSLWQTHLLSRRPARKAKFAFSIVSTATTLTTQKTCCTSTRIFSANCKISKLATPATRMLLVCAATRVAWS